MPYIAQDFIKDLQEKVDIVQTINKRVKLISKGNDYKACCPFHQEKTPSFSVSPSKQAFYCFGCGAKGYIIDFIMQHDNLNYIDAVIQLAYENGIEVEYDTSQQSTLYQEKSKKTSSLIELSSEVAMFYKSALKGAMHAIEYAKSREINGEIAARFNLGYAPNDWQTLTNGYSEEEREKLMELGLVKHSEHKNKYYDLFVNRLMFPIYNNKSQVIAFGGRALDKDGKPKYLNSPASEIFDKSATLYGLDIARKYSKKLDYLLIVEGYMDVISLHSKGITKVVATLGTATTKEHIEVLKRSTGHIIFCFDGDNAGRNAASKALKVVLPYLSTNMEVSFLFMPEGKDPDDVIKEEGVIAFNRRIQNATKLSSFLFEMSTDEDFDTIEGKTRFTAKAYEMISMIAYPVYRTQLLGALAEKVGKSIEVLEKDFSTIAHTQPEYTHTHTDQQNNPITIATHAPIAKDKVVKNYLATLTQVILNYPECASEELLSRIKKIEGSDVVAEIVNTAMMLTSPHFFDLIHIFKTQEKLHNRLIFLAKQCPKFTPDEAREELHTTLNALEAYQHSLTINSQITGLDNLNSAEQDTLIEKVQKGLLNRSRQ